MIAKTVVFTNFNFGRHLGLSIRGGKPVKLMTHFEKVIYIWLGLPNFREAQVENLGLKE